MKSLSPSTVAYVGGRQDVIVRHLIWFEARNRATGAPERSGLWTGDDARTLTIEGEARTYYGAGTILGIEAMTAGVGLDVRMLQVRLVDLTPEVAQLIRGYDTKLAPVAIHRALLDPASRQPAAAFTRVFRGWVDELSIETDSDHQVTMTLASDARRLTRKLTAFKSEAAMKARSGSDTFRDYTDVGGRVPVWWGSERAEQNERQRKRREAAE